MSTTYSGSVSVVPSGSVNMTSFLIYYEPVSAPVIRVEVWARSNDPSQGTTMYLVNPSTGQRIAGPTQTFSTEFSRLYMSNFDASALPTTPSPLALTCTSPGGAQVGIVRVVR